MNTEILEFDTIAADLEKRRISKVIRPDKELTKLPERVGEPKRVLLIVAPGTMEESYGRLSAAAGELPMLGLAFIAGSLREQGHEVKIIDYEVNHWKMRRVSDDIQAFQPDVVGLTAYISNMRRCSEVCRIAKEVDPSIVTVLGGPQVTIFPQEAFHSEFVDVVVLSEGEIIVRNLMNALHDEEAMSEVKGIWFRKKDGGIGKNSREGLVDDLDIMPLPAIDLFEMEKYFPPSHIEGRRVAHMLTSRGCPFKCTFCETKLTFGRSFRYHTTKRVLEELVMLVESGFDSFQFFDDIFTANKKRVIELCDGIIDRGLNIKWMCFTRTNCVSEDVLTKMKDAGCYLITFGGESGDDELLKVIKKDLTVETNLQGIQLAKRLGIKTCSSFMLGLPTETAEQTQKTINFALDSGLDYAVFPITEPYPGTELWVDAQKFGVFDTSGKYKNNLLSENAAVWIPHGRTRPELEGLSSQAMRRFYFRPSILFNTLRNMINKPTKRNFRYFWSGIDYFILKLFTVSKSGTRY